MVRQKNADKFSPSWPGVFRPSLDGPLTMLGNPTNQIACDTDIERHKPGYGGW
jgi:hypothetical protein